MSGKIWNSTLSRNTPLRATTGLERKTPLRATKPLARVNPARRKKLHERNFGSYADVIRALPCLVCERTPVDPHHTKSRGAGGDKRSLVPLCHDHHRWFHLRGRESFERTYMIDLDAEASELWHLYGDEGTEE